MTIASFNLVFEMIWIDDRAALEGADRPDDLDATAGWVDGDFRAGGDVAALVSARRDAHSATGRALFPPTEGLGGRFRITREADPYRLLIRP